MITEDRKTNNNENDLKITSIDRNKFPVCIKKFI